MRERSSEVEAAQRCAVQGAKRARCVTESTSNSEARALEPRGAWPNVAGEDELEAPACVCEVLSVCMSVSVKMCVKLYVSACVSVCAHAHGFDGVEAGTGERKTVEGLTSDTRSKAAGGGRSREVGGRVRWIGRCGLLASCPQRAASGGG
eukprot:4726315-Pleurochrysis_carterae.AAC.1